jgi:hypothetical protein
LADPSALASHDWGLLPLRWPPTRTDCKDSRLVLVDFTRLLSGTDQVRATLFEMIDCCIDGFALARETDNGWDPWRWLIVAAAPAAYSLRLPERIWHPTEPFNPVAEPLPHHDA